MKKTFEPTTEVKHVWIWKNANRIAGMKMQGMQNLLPNPGHKIPTWGWLPLSQGTKTTTCSKRPRVQGIRNPGRDDITRSLSSSETIVNKGNQKSEMFARHLTLQVTEHLTFSMQAYQAILSGTAL